MDFNDRNAWTTVLGIPYIDPSHLPELLEKLDRIQLIADPREKRQALVAFGIECKKTSSSERAGLRADYFDYSDLNELPEKLGRAKLLPDLSAKLKVLLQLQVELGFLCESD